VTPKTLAIQCVIVIRSSGPPLLRSGLLVYATKQIDACR
jgi:hypothetical protein